MANKKNQFGKFMADLGMAALDAGPGNITSMVTGKDISDLTGYENQTNSDFIKLANTGVGVRNQLSAALFPAALGAAGTAIGLPPGVGAALGSGIQQAGNGLTGNVEQTNTGWLAPKMKFGGSIPKSTIEVEGNELEVTPDGKVVNDFSKMQKHKNGGVVYGATPGNHIVSSKNKDKFINGDPITKQSILLSQSRNQAQGDALMDKFANGGKITPFVKWATKNGMTKSEATKYAKGGIVKYDGGGGILSPQGYAAINQFENTMGTYDSKGNPIGMNKGDRYAQDSPVAKDIETYINSTIGMDTWNKLPENVKTQAYSFMFNTGKYDAALNGLAQAINNSTGGADTGIQRRGYNKQNAINSIKGTDAWINNPDLYDNYVNVLGDQYNSIADNTSKFKTGAGANYAPTLRNRALSINNILNPVNNQSTTAGAISSTPPIPPSQPVVAAQPVNTNPVNVQLDNQFSPFYTPTFQGYNPAAVYNATNPGVQTDSTSNSVTPTVDNVFKPQGTSNSNQGFDYNSIVPYLGPAFQLGQTFTKKQYIPRAQNPYASAAMNMMSKRTFDINPALADVKEASRVANYNNRQLANNTGAYLAGNTANVNARNKATSALWAQKANMDNTYRGEEAQLMANLGAQEATYENAYQTGKIMTDTNARNIRSEAGVNMSKIYQQQNAERNTVAMQNKMLKLYPELFSVLQQHPDLISKVLEMQG